MATSGASLPPVNKREEEGIRKEVIKDARRQCKTETEAYVACTRDRFISVAWACRAPLQTLQDCLHQHTREEDFERKKSEFLERKSAQKNAKNIKEVS